MNYLKGLVRNSKLATELHKCLEKKGSTVHLEQLVGGAFSLYAAESVERVGGVHIFLMEDRDSAAYLVNDFYELFERVEYLVDISVSFDAFLPFSLRFALVVTLDLSLKKKCATRAFTLQ